MVGEDMIIAWTEIERLIRVQAVHRKGFNLAEVRPPFIIGQALEEMKELMASPDDPEELADLLGVLFHLAIKQGWSMSKIELLMLDKFARRFTEPLK